MDFSLICWSSGNYLIQLIHGEMKDSSADYIKYYGTLFPSRAHNIKKNKNIILRS